MPPLQNQVHLKANQMSIMKTLLPFLACFILWSGCRFAINDDSGKVPSNPIMCAPVINDDDWYQNDNVALFFEGMGEWHFPITTKDTLVQRYFNQGLILAYGFNHAEAARSFYYAAKLDSTCAMAYWGYAYVLGPNYNAGMESEHYIRAFNAIQKAQQYAKINGSDIEVDLIEALSRRYVKDAPEDRYALDQAYADAMKAVYQKYPTNADVSTLYAESLMNLHPWDLQDANGEDKEWTPEIIEVLEKCMALHPLHPGAHHLYIHAVEASNRPERALHSAQLFDKGLVPSSGHLVHMPSHVYIRTGDYHLGTLANIRALSIDSLYIATCNAKGIYPIAYYPHNQHFMAATATLEGNSKWAIYAAEELQKKLNSILMREPGWGTIQHYYTIPIHVYVKFGLWDKILKTPNEFPDLAYPAAIWHYGRGMAYLHKGRLSEAKAELKALASIAADESLKEVTIWDINSAFDLVQIAYKLLQAELFASEGNIANGIQLLQEAIHIEDGLNYNEPPDWFFSVRHNLGAMQLAQGLYHEAILTYQEDLRRLPKNGWALRGLMEAYTALNQKQELKSVAQQFKQAWRTADVELQSSVMR
jgi:tetratricopeptide (TPR) repeat protein